MHQNATFKSKNPPRGEVVPFTGFNYKYHPADNIILSAIRPNSRRFILNFKITKNVKI